jgi:hypothetical protein
MTDTSRRRYGSIPTVLVLAAAGVVLGAQTQAREPRLADVLARWTTAVMHHTPGKPDAALKTVWAMTAADRFAIRDHLGRFFYFMDGGNFKDATDDDLIVASAALDLFPLSRFEFIQRASTLHADAVIFDQNGHDASSPDERGTPSSRYAPRRETSGQSIYFAANDAEYQTILFENPNWVLARRLLDDLPPGEASQDFAVTWYHGVSAWLLWNQNYGQAETNLNHATDAMPQRALTLFDLGCVVEALGMNLMQQVIVDDNDPQLRSRPGLMQGRQISANERDDRASSLFERALAINPHMPEARVRWARLLELDKQWTAAAKQIDLALADRPDREVAFFAHLFGARAANTLNDRTAAERHLAEALQLFPDAQSALLAASDTALRHSDPALAKSRLEPLGEFNRDDSAKADPWLDYPLGPGRLPEVGLYALWRALPGAAPHN